PDTTRFHSRLRDAKPAVVYVATDKTFATLKTPNDLVTLLAKADADVRLRAEECIHDHVAEFAQPQRFDLPRAAALANNSYAPSMLVRQCRVAPAASHQIALLQ